jgi:hypothetical protein
MFFFFFGQGLAYFDQAQILDPISHLLPVKVDPLPLPISSPHGISVFKKDSSQSDNTAVTPTVSEQTSAAAEDAAPSVTSVGLSSIQTVNQLQESVGNLVSQPEGEPKQDHF